MKNKKGKYNKNNKKRKDTDDDVNDQNIYTKKFKLFLKIGFIFKKSYSGLGILVRTCYLN